MGAEVLVLVGVDLDQLDQTGGLGDDLFENRRQLLAGAAPRGPEIDQNRDLFGGLDDVLHEGLDIAVLDHRAVARGRAAGAGHAGRTGRHGGAVPLTVRGLGGVGFRSGRAVGIQDESHGGKFRLSILSVHMSGTVAGIVPGRCAPNMAVCLPRRKGPGGSNRRPRVIRRPAAARPGRQSPGDGPWLQENAQAHRGPKPSSPN